MKRWVCCASGRTSAYGGNDDVRAARFLISWAQTRKYRAKLAPKTMPDSLKFRVMAKVSTAAPISHVNISPPIAWPQRGALPPDATRGVSAGQRRGTAPRYARNDACDSHRLAGRPSSRTMSRYTNSHMPRTMTTQPRRLAMNPTPGDQRQVGEIKRVPDVPMPGRRRPALPECCVVSWPTSRAQVRSGPGAQKRRDEHQQRAGAQTKCAARLPASLFGIEARVAISRRSPTTTLVLIDRVQPEADAEDDADDPEALFELEFCGLTSTLSFPQFSALTFSARVFCNRVTRRPRPAQSATVSCCRVAPAARRRTRRSRRSASPGRTAPRKKPAGFATCANRGARSRSVAAADPAYISRRASALTSAICANDPLSASVSATADVNTIALAGVR